ncbi:MULTISPECIES: serine hydrolase domain-containing protein [unclassified Nocardioides]|uniref:serine hydrolase domain-containing protein n=1 Tax=unclassified Nocardioides TaxID=2615069 RepID=UPI0006FA8767|nr:MULTISPECIES: serine hydrolase domain-containing protein [unclassified Nocardioides]KRA37642.1 hydrolase [Nocardioides sp. Root614]KRA91602.1 hydrolase [Nocardioides sp. Root682]
MRRSVLLHDVAKVPDPFRRARIPKDLDAVTTIGVEADPESVGMTAAGIDRIWDGTRSLYRSGIHPAITLCVRRRGEIVLNRAIGHARGNGPSDGPDVEKVLATPETPFCIFSASKAVTATLVHLLDQEGVLHIADPVAEYLPGFARHGKDQITISHVLSHRAGIPALPKGALDMDRLDDWEYQRELMYDARAVMRPGRRQAYHAASGGAVLGEVIREVTGKSIREVLADRILDPLGFRWTNYGVVPEDLPAVGLAYPTGPPAMPPVSTFLTRALGGIAPDEVTRLSNDPRFLTVSMPAANVVSTAEELSRFFEMLRRGGELDGVRVLEERTIRRALLPQSHLEVDLSLALPIPFSHGFMLGTRKVGLYGDAPGAFGHLGFFNIIGWADPVRELSVGLITSGKAAIYPEITRWLDIPRRIGKAAPAAVPDS